jgi:hypothetical protein
MAVDAALKKRRHIFMIFEALHTQHLRYSLFFFFVFFSKIFFFFFVILGTETSNRKTW